MDLENIRERIDAADDALLDALAHRMELIDQVAHFKREKGLPVFDSERERLIFDRLAEKAAARGLDISLVETVLRRVISHSRVRQTRTNHQQASGSTPIASVAFQGAPGAYSWLAVSSHFGSEVQPVGCLSFAEAIEKLENGEVDRAMLPVQNSLAGSIHDVYSLLAKSSLSVVGEQFVRVDHCLIGQPDADPTDVTDVYSHPVALRQCRIFMSEHENIRFHTFVDTAEAVIKVKEDGLSSQAAIASHQAAKLHGLAVLKTGISDRPDNVTRFWSISRSPQAVEHSSPARISLYLVVDHREGALVDALAILSKRGVNMTKLESHNRSGVPWEVAFYLDLDGNIAEERMARTLEELEQHALSVRVLGCYPRGEEVS